MPLVDQTQTDDGTQSSGEGALDSVGFREGCLLTPLIYEKWDRESPLPYSI